MKTSLLKYFVPLLFCFGVNVSAQDLNCQVQVISPTIQLTNKQIFKTLELAMQDFINNRRWSNDKIQTQEKIECRIVLTVESYDQAEGYIKGSAQIVSSRPVYNSSYNSMVMNYNDLDWNFKYVEFQAMDYQEGQDLYNLTSLLAFYAYLIVGYDYDTYALEGGTPYFNKAQNLLNALQSSRESGWAPSSGAKKNKNRYWLMDNIMNPRFKPLREASYKYHRQGLDIMYKDLSEGRKQVKQSLESLQKLSRLVPNSVMMNAFFDAKSDELVTMFTNADASERKKVADLLSEIDVSNTNKYQKLISP